MRDLVQLNCIDAIDDLEKTINLVCSLNKLAIILGSEPEQSEDSSMYCLFSNSLTSIENQLKDIQKYLENAR